MLKPSLALFASLVLSGSAWADVSISFLGKDPSSPILKTSETGNVAVSALNYADSLSGSFQAYCIEPNQPNFVGFLNYTVGSFSGTQAVQLQSLYSSTFAQISNATQQGAFQLAVWEIVREAPGNPLDVTSGVFYAKPLNGSAAALAVLNTETSLANSYLAAAQSYTGPALYTLTKLSNPNYQDLVVAQAVPEPQTYAMFLAGLGAVGLLSRRRLRR